MTRVPNIPRHRAISAGAALEIATILAAERRTVTGKSIDPVKLAQLVLTDVEGWRPASFTDDGRMAVLNAFEMRTHEMEVALNDH